MNAFTLRARWVLPIDVPPIAGGYVSIADGRIAAISAVDPGTGPIEDLGDVVLLPGLINAHTHLEFSTLAEPLGVRGMSLPEWIRLVIGDRKRGDRDAASAIARGLRESLASGVTTIGEIATSPAGLYTSAAAAPATVLFQEAIGFSAGRVESVFGEVERRLDEAPHPAGISPHAPYTVHPRLLERLVQLAASRGAPVAMHLAESREELELLASGSGPFRELLEERSMWDARAIAPGSRPLDYLRRLAKAPRSLVIHGNYLAADEIEFIAQRRERMSVVYCPRTHAYFGHEPYPLAAMRAAGVRVALGTDGRASNPDLSVLEEVRQVANRFPGVSPADALRMAMLDAAEALGLAGDVGSLTVGKRADLVAIPINAAHADPYESVLESVGEPRCVWLGGNRL
ncbi:MAG: amidohydrolase family protein [Pirellulales bacterium]|nr:amidohydrolase family protein [Pirellulales bacterium]